MVGFPPIADAAAHGPYAATAPRCLAEKHNRGQAR
jgi:hypothetical protein